MDGVAAAGGSGSRPDGAFRANGVRRRARAPLQTVLKEAAVEPSIRAEPALIDARLLRAPKGYILPVANYQEKVGGKVTLSVAVGEPIKKVTSAYLGELPVRQENGRVMIELPTLGYGDLIRLDR